MLDFEQVEPAQWRQRITDAVAAGFDFLTHLTAVDELGRGDHLRVLAWLDNVDTAERCYLSTDVPRQGAQLDSVADVLPSAGWLERQVHDFFGIRFGDNTAPLLNHQGGAPLLKDHLLEPRLTTSWPGALEPGESDASPGRRRQRPTGVPDPAVVNDPDATAEDIARSASGIRRAR